MQTLEPVRAWSRACQLVIEHYQTAKSCRDPVLREEIINALLSLPVSLAESTTSTHPEKISDAMASATMCCAKIKTHLYIARELRFIEAMASDKFLVESIDMAELLTLNHASYMNEPEFNSAKTCLK